MNSTHHRSVAVCAENREEQMGVEEEVQVLMELDDSNLQFVADESVPLKHLVYRLVNTLGDESTALANIAVMFRGEEVDLVCVVGVFLALKQDGDLQRIAAGSPDDDDARVFRMEDWTPTVPLPLGNDLLSRLRIVILLDNEHFDPGRVKFGADLVPFPDVFLQGSPKMKRKLGSSVFKFKGGCLTDIEHAVSALSLNDTQRVVMAAHVEPVSRVEFWWSPCPVSFKRVVRIK